VLLKRKIDGVKCLKYKANSIAERQVQTSNCWICEGWT